MNMGLNSVKRALNYLLQVEAAGIIALWGVIGGWAKLSPWLVNYVLRTPCKVFNNSWVV